MLVDSKTNALSGDHEVVAFRNMMTEESRRPEQVEIVHTDGNFVTLNEYALQELLSDPKIRDKPVAVLSVAGPLRSGKSLLLSFMIRYLHSLHIGNWLEDQEAPLKGFHWRGGSERHTVGIAVWSEVFLVRTSRGEEIAVLLMDTQGMHDCKSTIHETANIFALSALTSSVQIYNVLMSIQENDLQCLDFLTEYGRVAKELGEGKPFQKLQFLVRDWYYPSDRAYGFTGGRAFLEERLRIHKRQHEEAKHLRQNIRSIFKEIDCFLMPHPGLKAVREPSFDGRLRDIDQDFKTQLRALTHSLLAPDSLVVKEVNSKKITCKQLIIYVKAYVNSLNGNPLPKPMSIYEATAVANNLAAMMDALKLYCDEMKTHGRHRLPEGELQNRHNRARQRSLMKFTTAPKMGDADLHATYRTKLTQEIDNWFDKNAIDMMERSFVDRCLDKCLDRRRDVTLAAGIGVASSLAIGASALSVFSVPVTAAVCSSLTIGFLRSSVHTAVGKYKSDNHAARGASSSQEAEGSSVMSAMAAAKKFYEEKMQEICGDDEPYMSPEELQRHHHIQHRRALEKLACIGKANGAQLPENIITKLKQDIDVAFQNFANVNRSKGRLLGRCR